MKKLLYLIAGYLAGNAVSSMYGSKKGKDIKKDMKKAVEGKHDPKMVLLDNFIETHKNFFTDLKLKLESEEAKNFFEEKKEEVYELIERYKTDSEGLIEELKGKGKEYIKDTTKKLEDFYKEKEEEGKEFLSSIGKEEEIAKFKEKLSQVYTDLKAKIKKKN
nr:hypothetical protein [Candidatus Gracilibacteria bacterium]